MVHTSPVTAGPYNTLPNGSTKSSQCKNTPHSLCEVNLKLHQNPHESSFFFFHLPAVRCFSGEHLFFRRSARDQVPEPEQSGTCVRNVHTGFSFLLEMDTHLQKDANLQWWMGKPSPALWSLSLPVCFGAFLHQLLLVTLSFSGRCRLDWFCPVFLPPLFFCYIQNGWFSPIN